MYFMYITLHKKSLMQYILQINEYTKHKLGAYATIFHSPSVYDTKRDRLRHLSV